MAEPLAGRTAVVIGIGRLGSPACLMLAAAGVGALRLVDDAGVERSHLTGEPLFGEEDCGQRKVAAAARRLGALFPRVRVEALDRRLDAESAPALLAAADVVVDGSGDFATMFAVNDAAVSAGLPLVQGAAVGLTAQLLTVIPGQGGCLRCLFEGPPPPGAVPGRAQAGVFGPLAGFAGALLGGEALRLLGGKPAARAGQLLVYEARNARTRTVPVRRRPGCSGCGALAPAASGEARP